MFRKSIWLKRKLLLGTFLNLKSKEKCRPKASMSNRTCMCYVFTKDFKIWIYLLDKVIGGLSWKAFYSPQERILSKYYKTINVFKVCMIYSLMRCRFLWTFISFKIAVRWLFTVMFHEFLLVKRDITYNSYTLRKNEPFHKHNIPTLGYYT